MEVKSFIQPSPIRLLNFKSTGQSGGFGSSGQDDSYGSSGQSGECLSLPLSKYQQ